MEFGFTQEALQRIEEAENNDFKTVVTEFMAGFENRMSAGEFTEELSKLFRIHRRLDWVFTAKSVSH